MKLNGVEYSWASVTLMIAGQPVRGVTAINYKTKQEKFNNYGAGTKPVSRSFGKVEPEASLSLHMSEVESLSLIAPNGDITQLPAFEITVAYVAVEGQPAVIHKLRDVEFTERGIAAKQGDAMIEQDIQL